MNIDQCASWMTAKIEKDGCLYQDDVVDKIVKSGDESLLRENADGNLVLGAKLLALFLKQTEQTVVWVRSGFYWRLRVKEDEPGRDARG